MIEVIDQLEQVPASKPGNQFGKRLWELTWPKLLAIAMVLVIWQVVHVSGWKKFVFAGPSATASAFWDLAKTGLLWQAIGNTVERAVIGFAFAVLIGSVIGALVSRIKPLRAAVGSMITALQTMPSIVWFPFAIIVFGISQAAIMFVIVLGAAPSVANGLIAGIDYTPPLLLRAGHMMGLRRWALYRHLILPASLPSFVAGLRQGWAFAWRSLMAGELLVLIANKPSLGVLLSTYQDQADAADVNVIMIVILILGILAHNGFALADRTIRRRRGLDPYL